MHSRVLLFLLPLLLSGNFLFAQAGFYEPGYILQGTDTITGYIERNDEKQISKSINFKTEAAQEHPVNYSPRSISGFGFSTDSLHFTAVGVEIRRGNEVSTDTRFAKNLVKGYVTLYKLQMELDEQSIIYKSNNTFVYIIRKEQQDYTLGQYEYMSANAVSLNKRYIGVLTYVLTDCPGFATKIVQLPFEDKAMIRFIGAYNICVRPDIQTGHFAYEVKAVLKHGPEIAYSNILSPTGRPAFYNHCFSAGYFLDYMEPDISRKLSTRTGLYYLLMLRNNEINRIEEKAHLLYVRVPLLGQFNLAPSPTAAISPFVNVGMTAQVTNTEGFPHISTLLSFGGGFYSKNYRFSVMVDSEEIKLKSVRILNFSVGYRLDNRGSR